MTSSFRKWLIESPVTEYLAARLRDLLIGALRQGPVPRHIAFIMDGNRRFARRSRIETVEGHNLGFEALARILEVCYRAGVEVVTIFAFSIENFKRSTHEVDALMDMVKVKLSQIAQHGELLDRYGACVRVLGRTDLLRNDVQEAINTAVEMTAHNKSAVLNVCFPYTSRDEMTTAIRRTVEEYSRPLKSMPPPVALKRPFSESRIARTVRSQRLETLKEEDKEESPSPSPSPPSASRSGSPHANNDAAAHHPSSSSPSNSRSATTAASTALEPGEDVDVETGSATSSSSTTQQSSTPGELSTGATTPSHPTSNKPSSSPSSSSNTNSHANTASGSGTDDDGPRTDDDGPIYPDPETITAETLTKHLFFGADSPPLDLLVRTSGVERLSDFMLWQAHEHTSIVFLDVLWPDFSLWTFLPVLVEWQWWRRKQLSQHREYFGPPGPTASSASTSTSVLLQQQPAAHAKKLV